MKKEDKELFGELYICLKDYRYFYEGQKVDISKWGNSSNMFLVWDLCHVKGVTIFDRDLIKLFKKI